MVRFFTARTVIMILQIVRILRAIFLPKILLSFIFHISNEKTEEYKYVEKLEKQQVTKLKERKEIKNASKNRKQRGK